MKLFKNKCNLAIDGMGRQGLAILTALVPPQKKDKFIRVIGVADPDPEAPGILYACRHNLFVIVMNVYGVPLAATGGTFSLGNIRSSYAPRSRNL